MHYSVHNIVVTQLSKQINLTYVQYDYLDEGARFILNMLSCLEVIQINQSDSQSCSDMNCHISSFHVFTFHKLLIFIIFHRSAPHLEFYIPFVRSVT